MRNETFSCAVRGVSDREQEIRRRYRLLGSLVIDSNLSGGRYGRLPVRLVDGQCGGIDLGSKPMTEEDTTLFIFQLAARRRRGPAGDVPPALTTWAIADTADPATLLEIAPARFRLQHYPGGVRVQPMPSAQLASAASCAWSSGLWPDRPRNMDWDRATGRSYRSIRMRLNS